MKNIYSLLAFLYVFFVFTPSFGAVDIIGPQWLIISLLNALSLPLLFYNNSLLPALRSLLNIRAFYFYAAFILTSIFSLIWAINIEIYFHDLFRVVTIFLSILVFYTFLYNNHITFIRLSHLIVLSLSLELFFIFKPLVELFISNGSQSIIGVEYIAAGFKGVTGNQNIAAASIIIKLPFVFLLIHRTNYFAYLLLPLIFIALIFLEARASYVSTFILFIIFLILLLVKRTKHLLIFNIFFLLSIIFSVGVTNIMSSEKIFDQEISSINISNESSGNRFLLWKSALQYAVNNPLGCGLGNWKFESIPFWKSIGKGYLVPYHAHNDFLEYTAELGFVGGLLYFFFFFFIVFALFKGFIKTKSVEYICLLSCFAVYSVDASLNFPSERPIMQIMFVLITSCSLFFLKTSKLNE